jgi:hypothetical protein
MTVEELLPASAIALDMTRNPIVVNVLAYEPVTLTDRTGLNYYLEIYIPTSYGASTWELLGTLEAREEPVETIGAVDVFAGAYFEISGLLDGILETSKPDFKQTKISVCSDMVTPYYCISKIYDGDDLVETKILPSRYAIKAGVSELDFELYQSSFFTTYIGAERRFLTYKPQTDVVRAGGTEYLNFLSNYSADITTIQVKMYCRLKNGKTRTEIVNSIADVAPMNVYCIPVSFAADVESCSVWLLNQDDLRISEVRDFIVDPRYRRLQKTIIFENSLGVFETFSFFGESAETVNITRQVGEQFIGYSYLAESSENVTRSIRANRELSISISWAKKSVAEYLTDLMYSKAVYLETDRSHLPLTPIDESYLVANDAEDWSGRRFLFSIGKTETNFSKLPTPELVAERPKGWRKLTTACQLDSRGRYNGYLQVVTLERYYLDNGELVLPRQIKPNINGQEGYIVPVLSGSCAPEVTPYLSAAISRLGSYKRNNCTGELWGNYPTINIAAGAWGSLLNLADANTKAENEWLSLDTQAYANANGACDVSPYLYTIPGGVPAGRFWVRLATPSKSQTTLSAISWQYVGDPGHRPGNGWWNQEQANLTDVVPTDTWDVSFPVKAGSGYSFTLYLNGGPSRTFKYYINGILKQSGTYTGYTVIALAVQPADGDLVFFLIE